LFSNPGTTFSTHRYRRSEVWKKRGGSDGHALSCRAQMQTRPIGFSAAQVDQEILRRHVSTSSPTLTSKSSGAFGKNKQPIKTLNFKGLSENSTIVVEITLGENLHKRPCRNRHVALQGGKGRHRRSAAQGVRQVEIEARRFARSAGIWGSDPSRLLFSRGDIRFDRGKPSKF